MDRVQRTLVVASLGAAALILTFSLLSIARESSAWVDGRILFTTVEKWWNGTGTLYPTTLYGQREPGVPSYRYPPLWGVTMVPLVQLFELRSAIAIWGAFSVAAFLAGLVSLMRFVGLSPLRLRGALVLVLLSMFGPLYETFYGPTKDLLMVGLVCFAFVLAERRRPMLAGLAFAGAVVLKIYPIFLALYFVFRGRFQMLGWSAAWFVVLNLLPLPLIGLRDTLDFYLLILPNLGGATASPENVGVELILMAFQWLAWFDHGSDTLDPEAFHQSIATIWRLAVLGAFTWLFLLQQRRSRLEAPQLRGLLFGTLTAGMLVVMPVAWANYQLFLVIPIVALFGWMYSQQRLTALQGCAAALILLPTLLLLTPSKAWMINRFAGPDPPSALHSGLGLELNPQLQSRIARRSAQLASVPHRAMWQLSPRERRALLGEAGVDDASSRGPRLADIERRLGQLQSAGEEGQQQARRGLKASLPAEQLTTRAVVGWILLRPLGGIAIYVGLLAIVALGQRPDVPDARGVF